MLRLTRHLYGWTGDARYFDFYERAHLNHIMSQQHPDTGMFTYFTALAPGMGRVHSSPTEDFWCCVGSGMESHSEHGESIYWKRGDAVAINLYYASTLDAPEAKLDIDTQFPLGDTVRIAVRTAPRTLALRVPGWCAAPLLQVNGRTAGVRDGAYLLLTGLKAGDRIALSLPMPVRVEIDARRSQADRVPQRPAGPGGRYGRGGPSVGRAGPRARHRPDGTGAGEGDRIAPV
ncbi:glycoside hydrolase family 127 protein [Sphingomonas aerolata]|uniref:beta-L-arabinofuranosidase domain-containing protein n=1 Tax=Sphingomonas aerolata TaxID=185951 RepID=UPI002FE087D1